MSGANRKDTPATKAKAKAAEGARSAVGARLAKKAQAKPRGRGKPFEKGNVPKSPGRPKLPDELKAAFRADALDALKVLEQIMRSTKARPEARIKAAEVILNRGYGTPTQSVELTGKDGGPIESMTHEQALARLAELRAKQDA